LRYIGSEHHRSHVRRSRKTLFCHAALQTRMALRRIRRHYAMVQVGQIIPPNP